MWEMVAMLGSNLGFGGSPSQLPLINSWERMITALKSALLRLGEGGEISLTLQLLVNSMVLSGKGVALRLSVPFVAMKASGMVSLVSILAVNCLSVMLNIVVEMDTIF
ncbi:hypothetical protein XdyCFBP7245_22985 [Xanthomonas dyei]|uniref:Uncharacterized protein n=1 Tax=Xanthomonas dyei TaxID=743699 RepID=A0A2S7BG38_9XANT|nr:hypothetical protein XdyCFBP7245_22985 [Xanthomonas dyei]